MAMGKQITTIPKDTLTPIGVVLGTTACEALTLVDLEIYKKAYFEIYENDILIARVECFGDKSYIPLISGEKMKYYDFNNLKIKTNADSCKVIMYCTY